MKQNHADGGVWCIAMVEREGQEGRFWFGLGLACLGLLSALAAVCCVYHAIGLLEQNSRGNSVTQQLLSPFLQGRDDRILTREIYGELHRVAILDAFQQTRRFDSQHQFAARRTIR